MDIDSLLAPQRWTRKACTVGQALAEITDPKVHAKVAAACDDQRVPPANIEQVFTGLLGDSPKAATIRRHQGRKENSAQRCDCP